MPGMICAFHRRKLSRVSFSEIEGPNVEWWEWLEEEDEDDAMARCIYGRVALITM